VSAPGKSAHEGFNEEQMKDQEEIQIAWEIVNLIEKLSHLLWNRYERELIEIYLTEEDDKFLRTIAHPGPVKTQDKKGE
jgi:hypothetical protein